MLGTKTARRAGKSRNGREFQSRDPCAPADDRNPDAAHNESKDSPHLGGLAYSDRWQSGGDEWRDLLYQLGTQNYPARPSSQGNLIANS